MMSTCQNSLKMTFHCIMVLLTIFSQELSHPHQTIHCLTLKCTKFANNSTYNLKLSSLRSALNSMKQLWCVTVLWLLEELIQENQKLSKFFKMQCLKSWTIHNLLMCKHSLSIQNRFNRLSYMVHSIQTLVNGKTVF